MNTFCILVFLMGSKIYEAKRSILFIVKVSGKSSRSRKFEFKLFSIVHSRGQGALECNMKGKWPFFKNLYSLFGKKCAFQYTVWEV